MKRIFSGRLSGGLCVCVAVLLFFPSVGIAQQKRASNATKSTVEFLAGFGGATLLGYLGARIGWGAADPHADDPAEPIVGGIVGLTLGSTAGVGLTAKALNDNGSWGGAFWGALACPALGLLGDVLSGWQMGGYGIFLGALLSPLGATTGYALTRGAQPPESQALLHIEDSKLQLGVPSPTFRPVLLPKGEVTWEYYIKVVTMPF